VFPVGSIYTSYSVSTDPATVLGFGTWSAIQGKVLAAYQSGDSDFGTAGGTGGSKDAVVVEHNHGITDPGHNHTVTTSNTSTIASGNAIPLNYLYTTRTTSTSTTGITINNEGVSGTGKNLQPYVTVHMWRRTA
jgi:microcystin-dependent protein